MASKGRWTDLCDTFFGNRTCLANTKSWSTIVATDTMTMSVWEGKWISDRFLPRTKLNKAKKNDQGKNLASSSSITFCKGRQSYSVINDVLVRIFGLWKDSFGQAVKKKGQT